MMLLSTFKKFALCVIFCLIAAAPLRADDVGGNINGFVYAFRGGAQRSALVRVFVDRGVTQRFRFPPVARRTTNGGGFFTFLGLLPGRYVVVASKNGFGAECVPGIVVRPGSMIRISLVMRSRRSFNCNDSGPAEPPITF